MPMDEEDYNVLRNEADAEPARYARWDHDMQFRQEYERRHSHDPSYEQTTGNAQSSQPRSGSEDAGALERAHSAASSSSSSTASSDISAATSGRRPELEAIRTQRLSQSTGIRPTETGRTESTGILQRHPTERHPEAIRRIETHRSQHQATVGATSAQSLYRRTTNKSQRPLPTLGAGKPYPPLLPDREEYVVEYDGADDPLHAQNWKLSKKLYIGAILSLDALSATMGSSIFSPTTSALSAKFHVATEVITLGTSFFVFGYAFGPLIWAPLSELYGRRLPILIGAFGFSIFSLAVAVGKDLQTVLICRFFAGLMGSCPLAVVAAVFADMFSNETRGLAIAVFSAQVFMGPLLAPMIGGFIVDSYLGWRWTEYISAIMGFTSTILLLFFMEETYGPVILVSKASELRRRTKNWGIHAKQEEIEVDIKELIKRNLSRPLRILFTEPICLLLTIYMSFIYGLLYLLLTGYNEVFVGVYGWNLGQEGLSFIGMILGELIAFAVIWFQNAGYVRKLKANNNIPVPEWRLPITMVAGPLFAGGMFWFGWTGYTGRILWVAPVLSGLFTGFGIFSIFLSLLNYLIDCYLMFAASAIAGNTFMRSICGGVFPLFASYMYQGMGIEWAQTFIGCLALLLVPAPFILYFFGKKIRSRSSFAPAPDIQQDKKKDEESRAESSGESEQNGERNNDEKERRE